MGAHTIEVKKPAPTPIPVFLVGPKPSYALGLIAKKWGPFQIVGEARELTMELARALNPREIAMVVVNDPSLLYRKNTKEVVEILEKRIRLLVVEADRKAYPRGYITIVYELGFIPLASGLKKIVGVIDIAYSIYEKIRKVEEEGA